MIVADASVVIDMLLGQGSEAGDELAARFLDREAVCCPHLVDAEVGQVLRRFVLGNHLSQALATDLVNDLGSLPMRRFDHGFLLPVAMHYLHNVSVYDGLYLALAEALECDLLTGDAALADVPGCRATVRVLETGA